MVGYRLSGNRQLLNLKWKGLHIRPIIHVKARWLLGTQVGAWLILYHYVSTVSLIIIAMWNVQQHLGNREVLHSSQFNKAVTGKEICLRVFKIHFHVVELHTFWRSFDFDMQAYNSLLWLLYADCASHMHFCIQYLKKFVHPGWRPWCTCRILRTQTPIVTPALLYVAFV